MVIQEDTICAIVTPPGIGGISVIRLSGKDAISIASRLVHTKSNKPLAHAKTNTIHYGHIINPLSGEKLDEVLAGIMRSPHSFTCEDVVEVSCHGGPLITGNILETFVREGARLAGPGEFTKRAFLNGRLDLSQAEAVIDIIKATTDEGLRCALGQLDGQLANKLNMLQESVTTAIATVEALIDFPEDDIRIAMDDTINRIHSVIERIERLIDGYYKGRPLRDGVLTAIVGRTNVGKSSLLNVLLGEERAIVTPYPGTTRDIVDGWANIKGVPLKILDTAGLRLTEDVAEEEGIKRMYTSVDMAELILLILDGSETLTVIDKELLQHTTDKKRIIVINKIDKGNRLQKGLDIKSNQVACISAINGDGIEELKKMIRQAIIANDTGWDRGSAVSNLRHKVALEAAVKELHSFIETAKQKHPLEIQALHLRGCIDYLGEITGSVTTEDILDRIFSEFCIGK